MEPNINLNIDISNENILVKYKNKPISPIDKAAVNESLRKGIWVYFFLLIFEGALRKWVFPPLATPLLIVRDPVAIWLLITAWRNEEFPSNSYVWGMTVIAVISFFTALTVGHGSLLVALYGTRILLFHFPLIFLIGRIFTREDVIKMGKVLLIMAIPMAFLIALQFYSPQSAFINKGIGANSEGGGFSGALGYFRPPGTFSFTTGNAEFFSLVGVFIIYFWLSPKGINRFLLLGATICFIAAVPLSISRSLVFQIVVSMFFALLSIIRKPKYIWRMFLVIIGLLILLTFLSRISFFSNAIDALTGRFSDASKSEGDISDTISNRILGGLLTPLEGTLPFFGYGIGMGTNAGAQLLVGHADEFLISEGEWGRLVGEMGAILGVAAIFIRLRLCLKIVQESYKRLLKSDFLAWMLISVSFLIVCQGQWAQPTTLGFAIIEGGLCIAALKKPSNQNIDTDEIAPKTKRAA